MRQIKLSKSPFSTLCDDEDYETLNRFSWFLARRRNLAYACTSINGIQIFMHQMVCPSDSILLTPDHINGNGLDNQKNNLRLATASQQAANQKKRNFKNSSLSKYKGVCYRKDTNFWIAGIKINDKRINLGQFETEKSAAIAYNKTAIKYFGEFAKLNNFSEIVQ